MDADESDFLSFPHEPAGVARKLRIKKNYDPLVMRIDTLLMLPEIVSQRWRNEYACSAVSMEKDRVEIYNRSWV